MVEPPSSRQAVGDTVAVFAKAPIPGFAKTRLIPRLGAEGAAALHRLMVTRTLRAAVSSGFADVSLWCAPSQDDPFFQACGAGGHVRLLDQPSADLGHRMLFAFQTHLAARGVVVLVGTDCPGLSPEHLRQARTALHAGADAVLVPALDGGYVAIGLRRVGPLLFSCVTWGTSRVMTETRRRLRVLGWTHHELPALRDVDRPEDFEWLMSSGQLDAESFRSSLQAPYRVPDGRGRPGSQTVARCETMQMAAHAQLTRGKGDRACSEPRYRDCWLVQVWGVSPDSWRNGHPRSSLSITSTK